MTSELDKKNERITLFSNEGCCRTNMSYMNSTSIRFEEKRETETEPNRFRANVDLPPATVSKFKQVLHF